MFKGRFSLLVLIALLFASSSLYAQSGCFHSPEAPTDVLLLVGSAGMFYGSSALMKLIRKGRRS